MILMKIVIMKIRSDGSDGENGNYDRNGDIDGKEGISNYGRNGEEYSGIKCIECSTI